MRKTIALLHTADVHVATFDALFAKHDVTVTHTVRADWLDEVRRDGLSDPLVSAVSNQLRDFAAQADAVICTCSSLGPLAEQLALPTVFRIDQPMMELAVQRPPVLLVISLSSTQLPSSELLERTFATAGKPIGYRTLLCDQAWRLFESGDMDGFGRAIGLAVRGDVAQHRATGCIVLAQASMTAAEQHLADLGMPVYSSPALAAAKALEIAGRR